MDRAKLFETYSDQDLKNMSGFPPDIFADMGQEVADRFFPNRPRMPEFVEE